MLDNVDHVHDFINSTRRLCSRLGGWVSGLISKPKVSKVIFYLKFYTIVNL